MRTTVSVYDKTIARVQALLDQSIEGTSPHAILAACLELGLRAAEQEPGRAVEVLHTMKMGRRAKLKAVQS